MIVYSASKNEFSDDIFRNIIVEKIKSSLNAKRIGVTQSQESAFRNSLGYMDNILNDPEIPADSRIAIEYIIPTSSKRIDFIISGKDNNISSVVVIIELKQWEKAELTSMDAVVKTIFQGNNIETAHPSYQAWSYAALLEDFNEAIEQNKIMLKPCAYLHNYEPDDVITNDFYAEHVRKAPVFFKHDAQKLRDFIKRFVKYGDQGDILYWIDHGRIRPSKSLADALCSMLKGNQEFIMIDDQKIVYEAALSLLDTRKKQVLIVEGGAGTGKSVVAVNLLVAVTDKGLTAQYVTKNAAPRMIYENKLSGSFKKSRISNMFKSSGAYVDCAKDTFDALIVDEAHRLNMKSGMLQNFGDNQIKEIICASKLSIFFLDEDQKVTINDIGTKDEITKWAKIFKAEIGEMQLSSQFRCNGSDGYLAWLDNTLQKRETANTILNQMDYDFRIVDSPAELRNMIFEKNQINNKARLVAGYCWDWKSQRNKNAYDIVFPEYNFSMRWNLASYGSLWIIQPGAVNEIGCIHTCQGLELDYIGVIVGPDFIFRNGKIITDALEHPSRDRALKGIRQRLRKEPESAKSAADAIIKNTYKTLMTRGMKGCYVYFTDKQTSEYFKTRIEVAPADAVQPLKSIPAVIKKRLVIVPAVEPAYRFKEYLPIYNLEAACGYFGKGNAAEPDSWIKIETSRQLDRNMFVSRVIGRSMEPRINDGDYCVFRANVVGSRNDKIVLVQHNSISDPDTGGKYTVKKYTSKKKYFPDGTWGHEEITLLPLNPNYSPISIPDIDEGEFMVVAEFIEVLK